MRWCVFAWALTGCVAVDADPSLVQAASCEDLRGYLIDVAVAEVKARPPRELEEDRPPNPLDSAPSTETSYTAQSWSETNVQVGGVDELDFMKTDGEYIYAVADEQLVISRAWPVEEAGIVSKWPFVTTQAGLYLHEEQVVVIARGWSGVQITILDVSNPALPQYVRRVRLDGRLADTRRIGDRLLVVTEIETDLWANTWDHREVEEVLGDLDVAQLLPRQRDRYWGMEWEYRERRPCDCTDVWLPERRSGATLTAVLTLDLSDPYSVAEGIVLAGRADTVYSSPDTAVVAWSEEEEGPFASRDGLLDTVVHAVDIAGASPTYVDTAQVPGVLPDQHAVSIHEGVLRLATTVRSEWTSSVTTLALDDTLEPLDHLGGLAPGEDLYAARFTGDLGYLVTYVVPDPEENGWETVWEVVNGDPLFTLDLSDPGHIRAPGELVMNGWSDYIHPMAEDHLLTVGMDQDSLGGWHVALSLFDVSDLSDPILEDRELLPAATTEASDYHRAFTYYAPLEVVTLPTGDQWTDDGSALQVLHADVDGIHRLGQLEAPYWGDCARARRTLFMEETIWTWTGGGLVAASLDEPSTQLATVDFTWVSCTDW